MECLQSYINSIIKVSVIYEYNYCDTGYEIPMQENLEPKKDYSILEVLLLALTYYVIKNFYTSIKTDTQKWWNFIPQYECIEIGEESLEILPFGAFLELGESKIPLCFSKQSKEKLLKNSQAVFCIEEFVIELENKEDTDEIDLEGILEEFFKEEYFDDEFKNLENSQNSDNSDNLAKTLKKIEEELQNKKSNESLKLSESLQVMIEHFITSFFPFASLF